MVIWSVDSVLDMCSLILNRAGGLGLTALHQAQQLRNWCDIGRRLGAVATTWPTNGRGSNLAVDRAGLPVAAVGAGPVGIKSVRVLPSVGLRPAASRVHDPRRESDH
jgi:hypothetical protein